MTTTVDFPMVQEAAELIAGVVHRTPVLTSRSLDEMCGCRLFLKAEHLQRGGAFKIRGASHFVARLPKPWPQHIVAHSSGNHAQAVAIAAASIGAQAHLVMPASSSAVKLKAVEGYGGRIVLCEPNEASRRAVSEQVLAETGGVFIPPYDHPDIVAGQGTAALELIEQVAELQVGELDAIVAPVGGGGLISGTTIAARGLLPNCQVFGAEPLGADDAARSLASGQLLPEDNPNTIADGLRSGLGEINFEILQREKVQIFTVTEEQIVAAMRVIWERTKQLIEPSAAVAVAAVLEGLLPKDLQRVGVILSGGNLDLDHLPFLSGRSE